MKYSTPRSTSDRVVNSLSRVTIQSVDDSHLWQTVNFKGFAGETQQNIEHPQTYGLVSHVQPPTNETGSNSTAESVVGFLGGNRSHGVVLITDDRRYRMQNLQPGEVSLHDDQGQQHHITRSGLVSSVPYADSQGNSFRHIHQLFPKGSSALNSAQGNGSGSGSGSDPTAQFGQTPWATLVANNKQAPHSFHALDNKSRTTQHPGTIQHQISDPKDADDPKIPSPKKKIIHSHLLDQMKGSILSIAKGMHTRTVDPIKGILDAVGNGLHSLTMDPKKGIIQAVENGLHTIGIDPKSGINLKSVANITSEGQSIIDQAQSIIHNGPTNITSTLNVAGLAGFAGGLGTGALEVATDADGGLVRATMGLEVTSGLTTDTLTVTETTVIQGAIQLPVYTIAGLATIPSPTLGMMVYLSDTTALATPTFNGTVTGGGAVTVKRPVTFNGTNWIY